MAASTNVSLSASRPLSHPPAKIQDYQGLEHVPALDVLADSKQPICDVKPLSINVRDEHSGSVPGFLHLPASFKSSSSAQKSSTAAILLSGAGGGVTGPSSIYTSIGDKLASLKHTAIPVLRLDYRFPARNQPCVKDVLSAMDYLEIEYGLSKFVLVGWSFGGCPVFSVAGLDKQRVTGCATIASQTAGTSGIRNLSPRPLLLLHGTGDRTLSPSCSESLYQAYGSKGDRKMKLFDGDDHALRKNSVLAEQLLCNFIMSCAGVGADTQEEASMLSKSLISYKDRTKAMEKGGDLRGNERMD